MKSQQIRLVSGKWDQPVTQAVNACSQQLVILMGDLTRYPDQIDQLRQALPEASLVGATTSGEILNDCIEDQGLSATLLGFEHSQVRSLSLQVDSPERSYETGAALARKLGSPDLRLILILSDGLMIFGSDLTRGLTDNLPPEVTVSGGLAGDDFQFVETFTLHNHTLASRQVVAVGIYGKQLKVSHGSRGGWTPFGPERQVTASKGHELLELDAQPALEVYKNYLGDKVDELPGSGLRYPLEILQPGSRDRLVRTMLAVDESKQSITFAGGIPEGSSARLMRANVESIIDGASDAIEVCLQTLPEPQLAIMVSCVGRKQLLKQMADEELEVVREAVPDTTMLCGFYSYGEIGPLENDKQSELHNQTMTITCISELGCTDSLKDS